MSIRNILLVALVASGSMFLIFSEGASSGLVVGVLEDDRGELADWKPGPSKGRTIRPLFTKMGDDWHASASHPESIRWIISFRGRRAGEVSSHPNTQGLWGCMRHTHIPEPQPDQKLVMGEPSRDYSGWLDTDFNRPLILVSHGNAEDPDKWGPFKPTENQLTMLRKAFRQEFQEVRNCDEQEKPLPGPWQYGDAAIEFASGFRSCRGDSLVGMFLSGGKCGLNPGPFRKQMFVIGGSGSIEHITVRSGRARASTELSLTFVDAGDFDADGESEVIFFLSGYNEDGYAILYDSFKKSVSWTWTYH